MKLIDNYLEQIKANLSSNTDDDVLAEIESNIYDELEDMAGENGTSVSEQQALHVLKKLGSPAKVAAQYAPQQWLIGPEYYGTFRKSLKVAFYIVIIFKTLQLSWYFGNASDPDFNLFRLVGHYAEAVFVAFGYLVLIFVSLEHFGSKLSLGDNWDPARMAQISASSGLRETAITNVISSSVFLVIWNRWLVPNAGEATDLGELTLSFPEVFTTLYWPVNLLLVSTILLYALLLILNYWQKTSVSAAIFLELATLLIFAVLLANAGDIVVSNVTGHFAERIAEHVNTVLQVSFAVVIAISGYDLWKQIKVAKSLR